ncbi:hypothetical protein HYC85_015448 [Camellia sinensis]|uniref:GDSL esterase/lipase n=1 Tax=Camellia sinensis TaxID=4442 RepID=A0A7J7GX45_CAMSI|nr:hypothetical protein HYC85_015448 [Camellia sinensis]
MPTTRAMKLPRRTLLNLLTLLLLPLPLNLLILLPLPLNLLTLLLPSLPLPLVPGSFKGSFSAVFAFGDSYTGAGNAHGTSSGHASTTTRECDGRQLVDFLCDSLSLPPLPAYKGTTSGNFKHGVNFAISGSMPPSSDGKNKDHAGMWSEFSENVQTQINGYNKVAQEIKGGNPSSGTAEIEGALFWVGAMGVKTYANNSWSSTTPLNKLTDLSVIHICGLVQSLLDSGSKVHSGSRTTASGVPPSMPSHGSTSRSRQTRVLCNYQRSGNDPQRDFTGKDRKFSEEVSESFNHIC